MNDALLLIKNADDCSGIIPKDRVENWLKSLSPYKHWKPTEEQLEVLGMVLSNLSMDDNCAKVIRELKEQLETL